MEWGLLQKLQLQESGCLNGALMTLESIILQENSFQGQPQNPHAKLPECEFMWRERLKYFKLFQGNCL